MQIVTDLALLCRYLYLATRDARFKPTLSLLVDLLSDYSLCAKMLQLLKKIAVSEEEKGLVRRIENDCFHPCTWKSLYNGNSERNQDYESQVEWRTHTTRRALGLIKQTPGVERGFCSVQNGGLDMQKWIYDQRRIIVLRFGPRSGSAGEYLSRICLEDFYQAVFARGLELPAGKYTFLVADEFQDFVDFDGCNQLNDNAFTAKSREFGNILIVGTQSLSALITRGGLREKVECFVNNCNNRIMLYSDDPWTQEVAGRYEGLNLTGLGPGKGVVVKFDQASRRHEHGLEGLQKAHDTGLVRLAEGVARIKASAHDGRKIRPEEPALPQVLEVREALEGIASFPNLFDSTVFCGPRPEKSRQSNLSLYDRQSDQAKPEGSNLDNTLKQLNKFCSTFATVIHQLEANAEKMNKWPQNANPFEMRTKLSAAHTWLLNAFKEVVVHFKKQYFFVLEERCKSGDLLSKEERCLWAAQVGTVDIMNNTKEFVRLSKAIPIEADVALFFNEYLGKECLLTLGLNLAVANKELGPGWLDKFDGTKKKQNKIPIVIPDRHLQLELENLLLNGDLKDNIEDPRQRLRLLALAFKLMTNGFGSQADDQSPPAVSVNSCLDTNFAI